MRRLTNRQRDLLQFLIDETEEEGKAPTAPEIIERMDCYAHLNQVYRDLDALEAKRYITRRRKVRRSILILRGPDQPLSHANCFM